MGLNDLVKIATVLASRVLAKYKPAFDEPINIFSFVESEGIIMNFQPLGNLAAAYFPPNLEEDSPPGILINEKFPLSLQRFSAAHELCHHIRKDPVTFDTHKDILNPGKNSERIAEIFASSLLMPRPLVRNTLDSMGVPEHSIIDNVVAYSLSLRLGVSYLATVHRLFGLGFIGQMNHIQLLKSQPKEAKLIIGAENLDSIWNDTWFITEHEKGNVLSPRQGDVIIFQLNENPTTGYKWIAPEITDFIKLIDSRWEQNSERIGGNGIRRLEYKVLQEGKSEFNIINARPWDSNFIQTQFAVSLNIQAKRHGISELQFAC